jgi:hypothetical protein
MSKNVPNQVHFEMELVLGKKTAENHGLFSGMMDDEKLTA